MGRPRKASRFDLEPRVFSRMLRELATWLEGGPQEPASIIAGWQYLIVPNMKEASMGEVTVDVGAAPKRAVVQFVDADGNVVPPDATPSWSSGDELVATVAPAEDGMSAVVSFGGAGSAIIECSTVETDEEGNETIIRIPGAVHVSQPDVDAVGGEMTFEDAPA